MSKILVNQISNYGDNSPIEVKEGLNIPAGKPLQAAGASGSSGQVLTSTGTSVQWTTPFDGDYNSLINKPTIPAAQVSADWTATSGVARILNKPIVPPLPSVTTAPASGSGSLSYTSFDGEFTFTPPDLSPYLTSLGDAAGVTTAKITNWDTAYSWGDHAQAGYLTSYTETDPVFAASDAAAVTAAKITNWDTAHGWGDHGQAGYLTDLSGSSLGDLANVDLDTNAPTIGQVLTYDGANWIPGSAAAGGGGGVSLTDFSVTTNAAGTAALSYNNLNGTFTYTPPDLSVYLTNYTETDPVFAASEAANITATDTGNWDTAYGWGDHSTQGYIAPDANDKVTLGDTVPQSWDTWANTWGRYGYDDYARGSCADSSENIYVFSDTRSPDNWPVEGLFSKFNSNGDLIFSKKFTASTVLFANQENRLTQSSPKTGPALDEARSCVYVIVDAELYERSSHLVKLSTESGNVVWAKSIGDGTIANDPGDAATINVDPSNGNVVFAYRGHKAYAFDTDGNSLWSKDFTHVTEGSSSQYNTQLIPDGNGNYYYIYRDCIEKLTTTTTPLDTSLWSKKFAGSFSPHVVKLDSNGDLILCDWFGSKIRKISKVDGSIIWQKVLSSGVYFEYTSIDSDDNIYLAGDTYNFGTWIYKIDTNGNLIKRKKIQGSEWYGSTGDAEIQTSVSDFQNHISVVNGNLYITYSYYAYLGSGAAYNCGLLKTKSSLDSTTDHTYRSLIRRESPIIVSDFDPLVDYYEEDDNYTDDADTVTTIAGFTIVDHTFTLNTISYSSTESKGISFDKFSSSWKQDLVSSNIIEGKVLKVDEAIFNRIWMGGLYFGDTSVDSFSIVANNTGKGSEWLIDSEGDSYDYAYWGYSNVIIGPDAAFGATGNFSNSIIVGDASGFNNRGSDNIFLGKRSGVRNESGSNNIYLGQSSARSIGSGSNNIALGPFSGSSENQYGNVALDRGNGSYNINLGYFSGAGNITGNHNISSGQDSLRYNKSGIGNIALGYRAMQQTSSKDGFSFTNVTTNPRSASYNIAIGYQAASLLGSEATHQIVLGNVESLNPTAIGQLAIGVDTDGTDRYWLTGDSSFNVDIPQQLTAGSLVAGGLTYPTSNGTSGDVLTSDGAGNVTWAAPTGGGGANVTISDTAPGSANAGDLWWESDTGRLKIRYHDVDSQQWVDASPPLADASSIGGSGTVAMKASIIPDTNAAYDIGSAEYKIRDLYLDSGSIHTPSEKNLSFYDGNLTWGGDDVIMLQDLKDMMATATSFEDFKNAIMGL